MLWSEKVTVVGKGTLAGAESLSAHLSFHLY